MSLNRREFAEQTLGSLLTWSLLHALSAKAAFGAAVQPIAAKWLADLHAMSQDLKGEKLTPVQWQKQVEQLFGQVELKELMTFIDFDRLTKDAPLRERGETSLRPKLPQVEGLPTNLVYGHQVFALNAGRSVVPHGHDNMATAFLVLKGQFHGRCYDRLEDDKQHIVIRPTVDRKFEAGGVSTVSDVKDNVHWFQAAADGSYIFNIHVMSVKPGKTGRVYLDPNGEKLTDGRLRCRKIDHAEADRLYG